MTQVDDLQEQVDALEATLGSTTAMLGAFEGELARMQVTMAFTGKEVNSLTNGISGGLRRAFDGLIFDGMKLSDALRAVAKSMVDSIYNLAMRPIQQAMGSTIAAGVGAFADSLMPFASGGVFSSGRVMPFAKGGIVSSPTQFPMRSGRGLMGEAGPEAIMPLTRGADGRLGIQSHGGGRPITVVMNVQTPDVQGFQRSQSQIAAQVSRALARGQRNR